MKLNHMFLLAWLSDNLATVAKYIVFFVLFVLLVRWCRQPVETTVNSTTITDIPQSYENHPTKIDSSDYYESFLPLFSEEYKLNTGDIYKNLKEKGKLKGPIYDPGNTSRDLKLALYYYMGEFSNNVSIDNGIVFWDYDNSTFKIVDGKFIKIN